MCFQLHLSPLWPWRIPAATADSKLTGKATKRKHLLFGMMRIQPENISHCWSNEIAKLVLLIARRQLSNTCAHHGKQTFHQTRLISNDSPVTNKTDQWPRQACTVSSSITNIINPVERFTITVTRQKQELSPEGRHLQQNITSRKRKTMLKHEPFCTFYFSI
jgi:hypothetical protein